MSAQELHGVFRAVSAGGWNIEPLAYGGKAKEGSMYPAQVRVEYCPRCPPMEEQYFKPAIAANYFNPNRFRWELNERQVSYMQSHCHLSCQPAPAWTTCSCKTSFHLHIVTFDELHSVTCAISTRCIVLYCDACCEYVGGGASGLIPGSRNAMATKIQCG